MQAPHSLALRAIAIHAVLDGLMAGLAQCPAGHLHGQSCLCAPLNGTLQPPAVCCWAQGPREMGRDMGRERDRERSCLVSVSAADGSQASALTQPTNVLDPAGLPAPTPLGHRVLALHSYPASNTLSSFVKE